MNLQFLKKRGNQKMCEICLQNPCDIRCPNSDEEQPEPKYLCERCDAEIYEGQDCYEISDMIFCCKCVENMLVEA